MGFNDIDFQGRSLAWLNIKRILLRMLVWDSLAALGRAQTGKFISDRSGDETNSELRVSYHIRWSKAWEHTVPSKP